MEEVFKSYLGDREALKLYAKDHLDKFQERYKRKSSVILIPFNDPDELHRARWAILDNEASYFGYVVESGDQFDIDHQYGLPTFMQIDTCLMLAVMRKSLPIAYVSRLDDTVQNSGMKVFSRTYKIDFGSLPLVPKLGSIVFSAADLVNFAAHAPGKVLAKELCTAYYEGLDSNNAIIGHPRTASHDSLIDCDWQFYKLTDIGHRTVTSSRFYATSLMDWGSPKDAAYEVEEIVGALQRSPTHDIDKLLVTVKDPIDLLDTHLFTRLVMDKSIELYSIGLVLPE